jgi:hypothetical protein
MRRFHSIIEFGRLIELARQPELWLPYEAVPRQTIAE